MYLYLLDVKLIMCLNCWKNWNNNNIFNLGKYGIKLLGYVVFVYVCDCVEFLV